MEFYDQVKNLTSLAPETFTEIIYENNQGWDELAGATKIRVVSKT